MVGGSAPEPKVMAISAGMIIVPRLERWMSNPPSLSLRDGIDCLIELSGGEDLADAYPSQLEETLLTEMVANSLDSGASRSGRVFA